MQNTPPQDLGSKDYIRSVTRAWERFVAACPVHDTGVRGVILESWQRCRRQGVNPALSAAPLSAAGDELDLLYQANERFRSAVGACLQHGFPNPADEGAILITSDPQGVLLSVDGDPRLTDRLTASRIVPGATWHEQRGGTNAIGTALALGRHVQIHAQEHFCEVGRRWSCAAGIVRDPEDREVLGVIDLTGPSDSLNRQAWPLVIALAGRIEACLLQRSISERRQLLDRFADETRGSDPVLLLDAQGRIVKLTDDVGAAIRARGAKIRLEVGMRLPGVPMPGMPLAGMHPEPSVEAAFAEMPEWLRPKSLVPLRADGLRIGAVLRIAPKETPRQSARAKTPVAESLGPALRRLADTSPSLEPLLREAKCFIANEVPVLIEGETGTGKDMLAQAIHLSGNTGTGPFIAINCAALPKELLASELFGYADGAFTGARRGGARGKFEQADRGTLFLDEIGDMPLDLQPYLLRALEERAVTRLGEAVPRRIAARVIAGTNRPLAADVAEKRFRSDLYYRLNVGNLVMPPLRERRRDIPFLADHFLREIGKRSGRSFRIAPDLMATLLRHDWPGNVRELRNVLERMACIAADGDLHAGHLPAGMRDGDADIRGGSRTAPMPLKSLERELILRTIRDQGGSIGRAAQMLGISRATLYRRVHGYRLDS